MNYTNKFKKCGAVLVVCFFMVIILTAWKSNSNIITSNVKAESLSDGDISNQTSIHSPDMDTPTNGSITGSITPSAVTTSEDSIDASSQITEETMANTESTNQSVDKGSSSIHWKDVLPIVISILAMIISLWHHFTDDRRSRKKDTLDAYNDLQENVFDELNQIRAKHPELSPDRNTDYRKSVMSSLARIERFSVGVNSGIYDIKVLKRCGGNYFIRMYMFLEVIIDDKRSEKNDLGGNHYHEFESVKNKLVKMYKNEGIEIKPFKIRALDSAEETNV